MSDHARTREYIGSVWARAALRGSLDGAARRLPAILVDVALVGSSLVAAAGAIAFAGSMLIEGDHRPKVNGLQYLAIFAQPHGAVKPSQAAAPAAPVPVPAAGPIDMTPFGSIGPVAPPRASEDEAAPGSIGAAAPTGGPGDLRAALRDLPPLIKGYLRLGARFGPEAVIDAAFGVTDLLVVLRVADIEARYLQHFAPARPIAA